MAGSGVRGAGRSVASKIAVLLGAFTETDPELSLGELSRRADLPLSTAYRLATELVDWGGLERADGGGYRVGLRLWEIGALAARSNGLCDIALPFMQDLYDATHENVHLAVLAGREALYIEKITGPGAVSARSRRGGRQPLHATGVGKALLAYAPQQLLDEVLAAGLKPYTPHTIVAPGHLTRALAEVRRTGVAYAWDELTMGVVSVASPVFDADGRAAAAISIVGRSTGANVKQLAPAVHTAALCASRQLGRRGRT